MSISLSRIFAAILSGRWWIVGFYAAILGPAAFYAAQVQQDNSLDRLIVPTDPDFVATRAFEGVFGAGEFAILMLEAPDPFAAPVVATLDRIEQGLDKVDHVEVSSALSIFRKAKAGFEPDADNIAAFKQFATGTELLAKQGLLGKDFLAVALVLDVHSPEERRVALEAIDRVIAAAAPAGASDLRISRLGLPYVNAYLDESQRSTPRYFLAFVGFVVVVNLGLYRSLRTLLAFLITLAVCLALSVGFIGVTGGSFTIVSPMVPMTILVTVTSTLVYLHSRFVDRPAGLPIDVHHVAALQNKFVACSASVFATAVGFAALSVSSIQPIRQMGLWVAVGLALCWVVLFTLFPALQKILQTPTREQGERVSAQWFARLVNALPRFTYRWRWPLVLGAVGLSGLGAIAIFGFPGVLRPMRIMTNPLEYMRRDSSLYRDIARLTPKIPGTSITQIWLKGKVGSVSEPEVLTGLHHFQQMLEQDPEVGAAIGATNVLRIMRYLGGKGDAWPVDAGELEDLAGDLETLSPNEPLLQRFVQKHSLAQTQITVVSRALEYDSYVALEKRIRAHWAESVAARPVLKQFEMQIVGLAPLHAKMAQGLVPTLVESFALTVVIIFSTFLLVFRNGTARLMAMIPSLFAILMMFALMRVTGMSLNIATILIASTVLGTSENDQIHFFYHFLERRPGASVDAALRHSLSIAGRAIFFATLINAGGFLAFILADLPAVRQFGLLSASAFTLSMIADFTALPAALWILSGEKPVETNASGDREGSR